MNSLPSLVHGTLSRAVQIRGLRLRTEAAFIWWCSSRSFFITLQRGWHGFSPLGWCFLGSKVLGWFSPPSTPFSPRIQVHLQGCYAAWIAALSWFSLEMLLSFNAQWPHVFKAVSVSAKTRRLDECGIIRRPNLWQDVNITEAWHQSYMM